MNQSKHRYGNYQKVLDELSGGACDKADLDQRFPGIVDALIKEGRLMMVGADVELAST